MEYQVPQFIEVEDKIIGPLTLRQFLYLAGAAGFTVVVFFYLPIIFAIVFAAPVVALGVALAFYKMNGKPFIEVLEAGFRYYVGAKLFLWKREDAAAPADALPAAAATAPRGEPRLSRGRLSELAWSLDIQNPGART